MADGAPTGRGLAMHPGARYSAPLDMPPPARPTPLRARSTRPDRLVLYEAAVQGVEYDLHFLQRVYRRLNQRGLFRIREDFCGTALLATSWALMNPRHRAWGVDLDAKTLDWSRAHRLARIGRAAERVVLEHRDVRARSGVRVDAVLALNFSYWVFKTRKDLLAYFRAARAALAPGGLFVVNAFGGTGAMGTLTEKRHIPASQSVDGERVPAFTYIWEHASFNPVDHHLVCQIHFQLKEGTQLRRAFTYDWRFWTLAEIREAMADAGFRRSEVHVEGWNEKLNRPDDDYRLRTRFENQEGWLAYIVGTT